VPLAAEPGRSRFIFVIFNHTFFSDRSRIPLLLDLWVLMKPFETERVESCWPGSRLQVWEMQLPVFDLQMECIRPLGRQPEPCGLEAFTSIPL